MLSTIWSSSTVALCSTPRTRNPAFRQHSPGARRYRERDVSGDDLDLHPPAFNWISPPVSAFGSRTPVDDDHSGALFRQPARRGETHTAHAADDDVSAVTGTPVGRGGTAAMRGRMAPSRGLVTRILPVWLPEAISRNASMTWSKSNAVTGSGSSSPLAAATREFAEHTAITLRLQPQIQVKVDH